MADVIFVAAIVAFFALSALYVTWCDRIIGPDDFSTDVTGAEAADQDQASEVAA
jgi:hypothetical protein